MVVLESILLVWTMSAALAYIIYFFTYGNLFQAEDMLPVLADQCERDKIISGRTDKEESGCFQRLLDSWCSCWQV